MLVSVVGIVLCFLATFPWVVAGHLSDGRVDTVEEVCRGDPKDQGCEGLFVIVQSVPRSIFPLALDPTGR